MLRCQHQQRSLPVKITTTVLIFAFLFFSTAQGQAEGHYIYKDAQGRLVISNQLPPPGSTVLRKIDLPAFREPQMQQVQQSGQPGRWKGHPNRNKRNKAYGSPIGTLEIERRQVET